MNQPGPVTRPRGRLPARVYWFRRGLVLGLALLLVGGLVMLVSSFGGGAEPGGDSAVTAAAPASRSPEPSTSPTTSPSPTTTGSGSPSATATSGAKKSKKQPLSASQGTCRSQDVSVVGAPSKVVGGAAVAIPLQLTTSSEPCTLAVSARSVVAKITSGDDRVWSSQDCPTSIPTSSVVVRPSDEKVTTLDLTWSGRRSTEGCRGGQGWAQPGSYHVLAATLGGQQSDTQFTLGTPPRPVVTKTAEPKRTKPSAVQTPKG